MLKAQVESITVEDKRRETATQTLPPPPIYMHTDTPQIKIETIFKQAE